MTAKIPEGFLFPLSQAARSQQSVRLVFDRQEAEKCTASVRRLTRALRRLEKQAQAARQALSELRTLTEVALRATEEIESESEQARAVQTQG